MKSILFIAPYDHLYPPVNGGMQRCFHLICQVARYFKVTLILNQDAQGFQQAIVLYPELANITVYSTVDHAAAEDVFSLLPQRAARALRYRWHKRSLTASADGAFLQYFPLLKKLLKTAHFDIVIIEKLSGINAVDTIRRYNRHAAIVYDAHNVDSAIAADTNMQNAATIKKAESNLYRKVQAIITCSDNDLNAFSILNEGRLKGCVIPNGVVAVPEFFDDGVQEDNGNYLLFCGSLSYAPNAEGLSWFYNNVWPIVSGRFTHLQLMVIGSGTTPALLQPLTKADRVVFVGRVADVKEYYNTAAVAIVPLQSGSGTRLKVLEAMAFGVPIVSTAKGAEGILYEQGRDMLIADDAKDFAAAVERLLLDKPLRLQLQQNAGALIKRTYDWDIIGKTLQQFLQQLTLV